MLTHVSAGRQYGQTASPVASRRCGETGRSWRSFSIAAETGTKRGIFRHHRKLDELTGGTPLSLFDPAQIRQLGTPPPAQQPGPKCEEEDGGGLGDGAQQHLMIGAVRTLEASRKNPAVIVDVGGSGDKPLIYFVSD